jgi:choline dehydrogenase-like flavoprotein
VIRSAQSLSAPIELEADLCVVGTGAGGAMVAREAARAGLRVVALEEGAHVPPANFTQREDEMIPRLFQDAGGRATTDGAVTVLGGRGVGGSTVHNTNLCKRPPAELLDGWGIRGWDAAALEPHYQVVERDLAVQRIEEGRLNRNNQILKRGVEQLGWRGDILMHNRKGCVGSGFCELGCAFDAKQNAQKVLVPDAVAAGATVYADCRAVKVVVEDGRATAVRAHAVRADGRPGPTVTVRGAVCLSGSAVGSARLALLSRLPDPEGRIGASLRLHPSSGVAGVFDEVVEGWNGIPQSYECTEHLRFDSAAGDRRVWIVPGFAHPIGIASLLPGFGAAHMRTMRLYPRLALLIAMVHDRTMGRVSLDRHGRAQLSYALEPGDQEALLHGMAACARILFAAGARTVLVPFATPLELRSRDEIGRILSHRYRPLDPLLASSHPMGTIPLGTLVDPEGRYRHVRRLWIADGSLFPTSIGVPPQLTIYAAAHKVAGHLVAELKS